jgi:hypothetical protein
VLVSALSVSSSARSTLRNNNLMRLRGGGQRNQVSAPRDAESIKDLANGKDETSSSLMSFIEGKSAHQECNITKQNKGPYQYYF